MAGTGNPYDFDMFDSEKRKKSSPLEDTQDFTPPKPKAKPVSQAKKPAAKQAAKKNKATPKNKPAAKQNAGAGTRQTKAHTGKKSTDAKRTLKKPAGQAVHRSASTPRTETPQAKARRVKQTAITVAVFVGVTAVAAVLIVVLFFNVSVISVDGTSEYDVADIVTASGIEIGDNLFAVKKSTAEAAVETALPYIGNATVKRKIPNELVIVVKPTKAYYAFALAGETVITNSAGKVLEKGALPEKTAECVIVRCEAPKSTSLGHKIAFETAEPFTLISTLSDKLEAAKLTGITSIDITDKYNIVVSYQGRITLRVGDSANIASKLALAQKVIDRENQIDPQQYGTIDLTIEDGKATFRPQKAESSQEETTAAPESTTGDGQTAVTDVQTSQNPVSP